MAARAGDVVGKDNCLDPCCVPPQKMEEAEQRQEDDPDGMFSAPVRAREGRMVLTAADDAEALDPEDGKRWAPIHVWRARAAALNGIA